MWIGSGGLGVACSQWSCLRRKMNQQIRAAGFSYLRYVNTASVMVRRCIKKESKLRKDSDLRDANNVIVFKWADGKQLEGIQGSVEKATAAKI